MDLKELVLRPQKSWFCAGTVVNLKTGELLVIDYWPDYARNPEVVQIKFPGGKQKRNEDRWDNMPVETFLAEMREEVLAKGGVIKRHEPFTAEENDHARFFFLMEFDGPLRTEVLFEQKERGPDGLVRQERLGPPRFVHVNKLVHSLFRGHRHALRVLCEKKLDILGGKELAACGEVWVWAVYELSRQGF